MNVFMMSVDSVPSKGSPLFGPAVSASIPDEKISSTVRDQLRQVRLSVDDTQLNPVHYAGPDLNEALAPDLSSRERLYQTVYEVFVLREEDERHLLEQNKASHANINHGPTPAAVASVPKPGEWPFTPVDQQLHMAGFQISNFVNLLDRVLMNDTVTVGASDPASRARLSGEDVVDELKRDRLGVLTVQKQQQLQSVAATLRSGAERLETAVLSRRALAQDLSMLCRFWRVVPNPSPPPVPRTGFFQQRMPDTRQEQGKVFTTFPTTLTVDYQLGSMVGRNGGQSLVPLHCTPEGAIYIEGNDEWAEFGTVIHPPHMAPLHLMSHELQSDAKVSHDPVAVGTKQEVIDMDTDVEPSGSAAAVSSVKPSAGAIRMVVGWQATSRRLFSAQMSLIFAECWNQLLRDAAPANRGMAGVVGAGNTASSSTLVSDTYGGDAAGSASGLFSVPSGSTSASASRATVSAQQLRAKDSLGDAIVQVLSDRILVEPAGSGPITIDFPKVR